MTSPLIPTRRRRSPRALALAALTSATLSAFASCDSGTIPTSVTLALRGGFPTGGALSSDTGVLMQLRRAQLTVSSVELVSCPVVAPLAQLRGLLGPSLARAHLVGSPTKLGVPHVIDLLAATATILGTIEPPAGSYCSARVSLGPADADAVGLPAPSFVGTMFSVGADLSAPTTRAIEGTVAASLTADAVFEPALALAEGDDVQIEFVLGDGTALDGLVLAAQTDDELAQALVGGARTSVSAVVTR